MLLISARCTSTVYKNAAGRLVCSAADRSCSVGKHYCCTRPPVNTGQYWPWVAYTGVCSPLFSCVYISDISHDSIRSLFACREEVALLDPVMAWCAITVLSQLMTLYGPTLERLWRPMDGAADIPHTMSMQYTEVLVLLQFPGGVKL